MRPTALLVDDDPTTLVALPDTLHYRIPHLRVETTTSVVDALARLEVREYSVVLTDVRMPRMDGLNFLREAKRRNVETPVVLMTGMNDPALLTQAFEAGAFDFLPKPLDRNDLSTTIQFALYTYGLLRDLKASQQRLRRYVERLGRVQTEVPVIHSDLMELASDLLEEATVVRSRARGRVAHSQALIQRNEERLQNTAQLLYAVQNLARQRSQERAGRPS
jgi:DNA-binding NtrC family response regulator